MEVKLKKENSIQLSNDWTGSSFIVIDGVHFAPVGFDDECGFDLNQLEDGLQERIHNAAQKAAKALNLDV